ncbi:MAG: hypothetical protein ACE5JX_20785 [Acidobacteriota bacterium]
MSIGKSLVTGVQRVLRFPSLILWIYLGSVLLAVPLTLVIRGTLDRSIGHSLAHENLRQGFDLNWYGEFSFQNSGLADTFGPSLVGALPMWRNLESLLEGRILTQKPGVLVTGILFLLLWALLAGGILDRFSRPEEKHSRSRLFSQGAEYFFRMLRLLMLSLLLYFCIFRFLALPLSRWVVEASRDVTVERTMLLYTLVGYLLVGLLLLLVAMVLDYAKISLIVESRRSPLLALFRGIRFVISNFRRCSVLYLALLAVGLLLFLFYALVAPGPGQSTTVTITAAFLVGQLYLMTRIFLKFWFLSGQTVLFQTALAPASNVIAADSAETSLPIITGTPGAEEAPESSGNAQD